MTSQCHILILEDNAADAELVQREIRKSGLQFDAVWAQNKSDFLAALNGRTPDLILADYSIPGFDGLTALALAREKFPDVPGIIVSGVIGEENAIEALKSGATDYVLKDRLNRLGPVVQRALKQATELAAKKRAEEDFRRAAAELERSNKELEQFAHVVSHDLLEPLRMVSAFTDLLRQRYRGKLDAKADEYISFAIEGSQRMRDLINGLLAYSRIGAGARLESRSAQDSLDVALANLKVAVEDSGAAITHDPMPTVVVDCLQLAQVFQNLIANAIKYRKPAVAPEIHIGVECVEGGEARANDAVWRFSVRDNGIGILPEFAEKIFEIFQRLHTREEYEGAGIGLATCKKIVERHGGNIWVESEPGKGSTFFFTMPTAPEKS